MYRNSVRSNLIVDPEDIIPELRLFKQAGGQTVVDISCTTVRKSNSELPRISSESGVNIIAGTGNYIDYFVTENTRQMTVQEVRQNLKWSCILINCYLSQYINIFFNPLRPMLPIRGMHNLSVQTNVTNTWCTRALWSEIGHSDKSVVSSTINSMGKASKFN